MIKTIIYLIMVTISMFIVSCSQVNLNGHYHLQWGDKTQSFQTWNIKNNQMVINRPVCLDADCFKSQLIFKGDKIQINPWVDALCEYQYSIEENGTINLFDDRTKMKLIPHQNCISNEEYFRKKTSKYSNSFELVEETMTGISVMPNEYDNELFILREGLIFNNLEIKDVKTIEKVNNKSIWLHVDKRVKLKTVVPILKELNEKGFVFSFSALSKTNNNEQIFLLSRNIEEIKQRKNSYEVSICDFCDKYAVDEIKNVLEVDIIEAEKFILQNDTTDLFQVRNKIVRFIRQNRNTRLYTQIQFNIPLETEFESYIRLVDEIKFVHVALSDIIIYNGEYDEDTEAIKNNKIDKTKEFPLRILEIFK